MERAIRPATLNPPQILTYDNNGKSSYPIDQAATAIRNLIETVSRQADPQVKQSVLVYVHGRALGQLRNDYDEEPEKSEQEVIPELTSWYNANILMFHWPHWGNFHDFPEKDARQAGNDLAHVLREVDFYAAEHTQLPGPLILITHSMGSIVLEEALNISQGLDLSHFHTATIFSSASQADDSAIWLSRIKSPNRYVFSNNNDPMLRNFRGQQLGECDARRLSSIRRADDVLYIDISPLGLGHRYFVFGNKMNEAESALAENVVSPIIRGDKPTFRDSQPYAAQKIFLVRKQ